MSRNGVLITFEGIDGSGKTTQINMLVKWLRENKIECEVLREPGGTSIGEKVREILLDRGSMRMFPGTELLLYSASRYQLTMERIIPALDKGNVVVCDRFFDSSTAYQGYGREVDLDFVSMLNKFASCGVEPDVTFLLDITVEERKRRLASRYLLDRLELEDEAFQRKVREGFLDLAKRNSERFVVLNGMESSRRIFERIMKHLKPLLEEKRVL